MFRNCFLFFKSCIVISGLFLYTSCNHLEYSPNVAFDHNSYRDLNAANLKKMGDGAEDDTVRFILSGDTQKSRDETVEFYQKANTMSGIDFLVLAGDISEFGVLKEMEWITRSLKNLKFPYLAVIGNHDLTARGREVFLNMFGPLNYSFVYGGIKFICHDTNGREYRFDGTAPNIPWLRAELKPQAGVNSFIAISHVPTKDADFDQKAVPEYTRAFAQTPGFLASLHAHTHAFESYNPDDSGIPYVITSAMGNREFLVVTIIDKKISFERVSF